MTLAEHPDFLPPDGLLPRRTLDNAAYWEAAATRRFVVPGCVHCQRDFFPISPRCPHCLSDHITWREPGQAGSVASWIRYRKAYYPWVALHLPYVGILVDVVPGVRIPMLCWPTPTRDPRIGDALEIDFLRISDDLELPICRLPG